MNDDFYRAFVERYRGARELILARLAIYLPFISSLQAVYPASPAIDLGCGRGEWLELLQEEGFSPLGIDQDQGMLQGCREHNLPVQQGDAVAYLATLPDESQAIVSAFHVVEHISFDQLRTVVSEALRILKPGGLLIMETPNPENIVVATRNFYLDPTHQRLIPSELLSFLSEYYGFARTKILRLQESKDLTENESPTLNNVLDGVSPDYAVIAQKTAPAETLEAFDGIFAQEYGLSLNTLTERFEMRLQQSEEKAQQSEEKARQAEEKAQQVEVKVQQVEVKVQQVEVKAQQAEVKARQAEVKARQAEAGLHAVYTSRSWRITEPLRWLMLQLHLLREHGPRVRCMAFFKKMASPVLRRLIAFVDAHCGLRKFCVRILKMLGIKESLRRIYCRMKAHDHFRDSFRGSTFQRNRKVGTGTLAPPGTISVEELLKRVKQELEDVRKNGASD